MHIQTKVFSSSPCIKYRMAIRMGRKIPPAFQCFEYESMPKIARYFEYCQEYESDEDYLMRAVCAFAAQMHFHLFELELATAAVNDRAFPCLHAPMLTFSQIRISLSSLARKQTCSTLPARFER